MADDLDLIGDEPPRTRSRRRTSGRRGPAGRDPGRRPVAVRTHRVPRRGRVAGRRRGPGEALDDDAVAALEADEEDDAEEEDEEDDG
jgi:hypothetical protein